MAIAVKARRKRSERGNWLVVSYHFGKIFFCRWVRSWAGVQASKRHSQKYINEYAKLYRKEPSEIGRVIVMDIDRMADFAATEGANEIHDLYKLFEK